jgi:hypothetical protein
MEGHVKKKVVFSISLRDQDNIPVQMKNKLLDKFNEFGIEPVDIGWNFGITYQTEGKEVDDTKAYTKKLYETIEKTFTALNPDLKIQSYEIQD